MATHPANAVFVSGDGKVSFNENGRKLDSLGNVVWGDWQGLRGANARVRPEIIQAYEEEEKQRQQQQQAPAMPAYRPPAQEVMGAAPAQQQANPWAGVSQWQAPQPNNWNQFQRPQRPQQPAWEPPPSGLNMGMQQPLDWSGQGEHSFAPLPSYFQQPQTQPDPWAGVGSWNTFRRPGQG